MDTLVGQAGTLGSLLIAAGVALLIGCGFVYGKYLNDSNRLRQIAQEAVGPDRGRPEQMLQRLNDWVFNNQGFAKNPHYFISPRLGPTPVQVLESGGDCADKSQLLVAMLHAVGIPSTLVMLYTRDYEQPTHTVVETRLPGFRAVADPVWGVVFADGHGGLLGVTQLKEQHDQFEAGIQALAQERGPQSKVAYYPIEDESYRWPRTINWDRMLATRLVGSVLGWVYPNPELVTRPRILSEPVLFVSALLLSAGLLCIILGWLLMR